MMTAEHISVKVHPDKYIVQDVSIKLQPGVLTAVIGKNGAGKSSVLKAICGDIQNAEGQVSIKSKKLTDYDLRELAKIRAIVSQKVNLEFSFTVREVVALGRSVVSGVFTSVHDEKILEDCLRMVDAYHLIDRSYTTLSGGEQQRVHFARAIAQIRDEIEAGNPTYLLLDEPLSSLDVAHQHEMMYVLKQLCSQNVAVLIILHDLNLAAQYADYVQILKQGKTVAEGTPFEVFTDKIISGAFDFPVSIIPHPKINCPLIVSSGITP